MGRRKFDIGLIQNERCRQVTFSKRKLGVIRKATELSVLCNSDVAVIIFGGKNKLSIYSSRPINTLVSRYFENQHKAEASPARLVGPHELASAHTSLRRTVSRFAACSTASPSCPNVGAATILRAGQRTRGRSPTTRAPAPASADLTQVVTTEDYFRNRARRAALGGHSDNEDAPGPSPGGGWPITNRGEMMTAVQPYQGHPFAQSQPAYAHNQYNPSMQTLQAAPVGQTMQAMQEMRLQLQQQQQLLHQQQLQHMQEQIQQQQEMLKRFTQIQPLPHADPPEHTQDRFQPQAVQAQMAQQPVLQPLQMHEQPQLMQQQCGFQSPAYSSYGGASQAMPAQCGADQAPNTQTLQAQLQQLQEQQSLVQQQLDTLQRPS